MPKTILVVEDDESIQELLKEALEGLGHTVVGEKDGGAAVKAFDRQPADLCVLDMLVPILNGMQVAERIRAHPRGATVPLVMVSGIYRGAKHRKDAVEKVRAVAYLEKPLDLGQFLATVSRALDGGVEEEPPELLTGDEDLALPSEPPAPAAAPVPERLQRGDVSATPFPELLGWLFRGRHTGALLLRREQVKKIVHVRKGVPVNVKSNLLNECLGKILVRERMLSDADCELSLKRMQETGRQQGTILVEAGLISPANLVYALQMQLEAKLYELFSWTRGEYQFAPREELPPTTVSLDTTLGGLLAEGIKRHWTMQRLQVRLRAMFDRFVAPHPDPLLAPQNLPLPPPEAALAQGLDGQRTLRELLADAGPGGDEARLRALYLLACAQAVELREQPGRAGPPPIKKPADATSAPPPLRLPRTLPPYAGAAQPRSEPIDVDKLTRRLREMRHMTHFEVLGISRHATAEEVRRAYFAQAKEVHPDRLTGRSSPEAKAVSDQLYGLLSAAYAALSEGRSREEYLRNLGRGVRSPAADAVGKQLHADGLVRRGEVLMRRRDWVRAHECFRQAAEGAPDDATVTALLGWTLFQTMPADADVARLAENHLERAVALGPAADRTHLLLGLLYRGTGRHEAADREFEHALQCNPDCAEARRELRPRTSPPQPPQPPPLRPRADR